MLDIILLIVVSRAFVKKAKEKGLSSGLWGAVPAICYIGTMIVMVIVAISAGVNEDEITIAILIGIPIAIVEITIAWFMLKNKPSAEDNWGVGDTDILDDQGTFKN